MPYGGHAMTENLSEILWEWISVIKMVLPEVDTNNIFEDVRSLSRTLWSPAILNLLSRLIGYSTAQGPQCEMPVETLLRSGTKIQIILVNEFDWSSATTPHCRHFATVTVAVSNPRTKTTIQYVVFMSLSLPQKYGSLHKLSFRSQDQNLSMKCLCLLKTSRCRSIGNLVICETFTTAISPKPELLLMLKSR
jgi:hypothetical protein